MLLALTSLSILVAVWWRASISGDSGESQRDPINSGHVDHAEARATGNPSNGGHSTGFPTPADQGPDERVLMESHICYDACRGVIRNAADHHAAWVHGLGVVRHLYDLPSAEAGVRLEEILSEQSEPAMVRAMALLALPDFVEGEERVFARLVEVLEVSSGAEFGAFGAGALFGLFPRTLGGALDTGEYFPAWRMSANPYEGGRPGEHSLRPWLAQSQGAQDRLLTLIEVMRSQDRPEIIYMLIGLETLDSELARDRARLWLTEPMWQGSAYQRRLRQLVGDP